MAEMTHKRGIFLRSYWALFHWIAEYRLAKQDLDPRVIHAHLLTVLSTGILMWAYVWLSAVSMASPIPVAISTIASITHLISPLLYRFSNKAFWICSLMLFAGMSHQLVSAIYSGGFNSHILIWFGILPTLAGLIVGMRGLVFWTLTTTLICLGLLLLSIVGFDFPGNSPRFLSLIPQAFMVFGWIFINSLMMYAHLIMQRRYERKLAGQRENVSVLLRVLTHDVSTPIAILSASCLALRRVDDPKIQKSINNIELASQSLGEITTQVRQMYSLSNDELHVRCQPYCLRDSLLELQQMFSLPLAKKSLRLVFDEQQLADIWVSVAPALFNHQVMANLISNAIKFSYRDSCIYVSAERHGEKVLLRVEDQGMGIPIGKVDKLFSLSHQSSSMGTESEAGIGYGLVIVKAFIERFDGDIDVMSPVTATAEKYKGTRFTIHLPAALPTR